MEMNDETRKDVSDFQNSQQQLQLILMQKQQTQLQLSETQKVTEEVAAAAADAKFFKSVGNVLVPKNKDALQKDLASDKEALELRASMLAKQEASITAHLVALQDKLKKAEKGFSLASGDGFETARAQLSCTASGSTLRAVVTATDFAALRARTTSLFRDLKVFLDSVAASGRKQG